MAASLPGENQFESSASDQQSSTSITRRFGAGIIDLLILMVVIGWTEHYIGSGSLDEAANLSVTFAYYALQLLVLGKTVGQALCGDVVVTDDGHRLTVEKSIRRSLWITVSYLLIGLPFLMVFFSKKRQAMHDLITHTVVVHQNADKSSTI